jgi:toxin ParE1/3/4
MDYAIILSPKAVGDLEAIVRYISFTNPSAARKVGQSLLEKTKELSRFPLKGQKVPEFNSPSIRQLILKPYRIVYRVEEDKKRIGSIPLWRCV